jgi:hypothetical protein
MLFIRLISSVYKESDSDICKMIVLMKDIELKRVWRIVFIDNKFTAFFER